MAGRSREEILIDKTEAWQQISGYSRPAGNCTVSPGPITEPGVFSVSGTAKTQYERRQMTDVVTPQFHKKVREGQVIVSPMSSSYERYEIPNSSIYFYAMANRWGCTPPRYYEYIAHSFWGTRNLSEVAGSQLWKPPPVYDMEALKDQAMTEAWANIDTSEMLFLATLKEFPSTVGGMVDLFKIVRRILKQLRRKTLKLKRTSKDTKQVARDIADLYLNARYNLRPLYYDMKALRNVLNKALSKPKRQTFRRNLTKSSVTSDWIEICPFTHPYYSIYTGLSRTCAHKVTVRAGVLTHVGALSLSDYLGMSQLIETGWDLVPFSFIVDWFLNVGDTIASWTPNAKVETLASWLTVKEVLEQTSTINGNRTIHSNAVYYWTNVQGHMTGSQACTRVYSTVVREPNYSRPVMPQFVVKLDPLKLLDLALILRSLRTFRFSSQG